MGSNKVKARALINENDNKGLNVLHYVVRNENASNLLRILLNIDSLEINHEDKVGSIKIFKLDFERKFENSFTICTLRFPFVKLRVNRYDSYMRSRPNKNKLI